MRVETAVKWGALGGVAAVTYSIYGPAAAAKLAVGLFAKTVFLSSASMRIGMRSLPQRRLRVPVAGPNPRVPREVNRMLAKETAKASRSALAVLSPIYYAIEILTNPGSQLEKIAHPLLVIAGSYWFGIPDGISG